MEFGVAQKGQLAGRRDTQPIIVKQPHHVTHARRPDGLLIVDVVFSSYKNVFATLHARQGLSQRQPERIDCGFNALLFIKWMNATPGVVRRCVLFKYSRDVVVGGSVVVETNGMGANATTAWE